MDNENTKKVNDIVSSFEYVKIKLNPFEKVMGFLNIQHQILLFQLGEFLDNGVLTVVHNPYENDCTGRYLREFALYTEEPICALSDFRESTNERFANSVNVGLIMREVQVLRDKVLHIDELLQRLEPLVKQYEEKVYCRPHQEDEPIENITSLHQWYCAVVFAHYNDVVRIELGVDKSYSDPSFRRFDKHVNFAQLTNFDIFSYCKSLYDYLQLLDPVKEKVPEKYRKAVIELKRLNLVKHLSAEELYNVAEKKSLIGDLKIVWEGTPKSLASVMGLVWGVTVKDVTPKILNCLFEVSSVTGNLLSKNIQTKVNIEKNRTNKVYPVEYCELYYIIKN